MNARPRRCSADLGKLSKQIAQVLRSIKRWFSIYSTITIKFLKRYSSMGINHCLRFKLTLPLLSSHVFGCRWTSACALEWYWCTINSGMRRLENGPWDRMSTWRRGFRFNNHDLLCSLSRVQMNQMKMKVKRIKLELKMDSRVQVQRKRGTEKRRTQTQPR